jgi:hypothetical protein
MKAVIQTESFNKKMDKSQSLSRASGIQRPARRNLQIE